MPLFGIDISKFNGDIDHSLLKGAGVRFAMVRATQGKSLNNDRRNICDSKLERNLTGLDRVGIPAGIYHFFTASTLPECYEEADSFIETAMKFQDKIPLFLACFISFRGNKYISGLSPDQLTRAAMQFCARVSAAGFNPCIFADTDCLTEHMDINSLSFPIWQAKYGKNISRPTESGRRLAIHRYTDCGRLERIPGAFPLNFGYSPVAKLVIESKADVDPAALEFLESLEGGEEILVKLADKLVTKGLHPLRIPTQEKITAATRYFCSLSADQSGEIYRMKGSDDFLWAIYKSLIC